MAKFVKIQSNGNQFQGASPATITLLAQHYGIVASSYQWYRGAALGGTNQSFIVANNQVDQVETFRVVVTATDGNVYEESISITKVLSGTQGRPGAIPIQREWKTGETHRNNHDVIDYIYHRLTKTWWRLKDSYDNVVAQINPTSQYVQLNSLEQLAVQLIVAEEANLAGFIFKENRLVSQNPSPTNPNLILDGKEGSIYCKKGVFTGIRLIDVIADRIRIITESFQVSTGENVVAYLDTSRNGLSIGIDSPDIPVAGAIDFRAFQVNGVARPAINFQEVLKEIDIIRNEDIDLGTMYMDSEGYLKLKT
ncbi:hypothetical protein [Flavobacterium sp. HSC-61S13]|uniref:hypothetical protein n=1 Tax=Flavobacterium sp. HSC-61S13 TaxID=2910963 RepID=UPI00209FA63C|nr:hypothetical protein [Flavobacterium sp. HSC-61S13]MCP1997308.1 hypothetical protein [Flavobacterium sp. HSC-61S13]